MNEKQLKLIDEYKLVEDKEINTYTAREYAGARTRLQCYAIDTWA